MPGSDPHLLEAIGGPNYPGVRFGVVHVPFILRLSRGVFFWWLHSDDSLSEVEKKDRESSKDGGK